MKHSMKTGILSAFTAGVMALGLSFTPAPAHAIPTLKISDGINTDFIVADGGADDGIGLTGVVLLNKAIGNFIVNVATGITKPANGAANNPQMDLNASTLSMGTGGTLTIMFTDTDFTDLAAGLNSLKALIGGTTDGTITYETWLGSTNGEFEMTTKLTDLGILSSSPFGGTASLPFSPTGIYSLTQIVTITHGRGIQNSSFDAELKAVPEPGTILLFGSGLMGLAAWRMRKNKASQ